MVRLIRSGLLDLSNYETREFDLSDVNEAVAHAAGNGAFRMTVVRPCPLLGLSDRRCSLDRTPRL